MGFTVLEIMIVVGIIGLLAVIVVPSFMRARTRAQALRFITDLRVAAGAFQQHSLDEGVYPPAGEPGVVPAGMEEYLRKMKWSENTPIGGQWVWDYRRFGVVAGISVYNPPRTEEEMVDLDERIDDGNLSTGTFRTRDSGYIYILEP